MQEERKTDETAREHEIRDKRPSPQEGGELQPLRCEREARKMFWAREKRTEDFHVEKWMKCALKRMRDLEALVSGKDLE